MKLENAKPARVSPAIIKVKQGLMPIERQVHRGLSNLRGKYEDSGEKSDSQTRMVLATTEETPKNRQAERLTSAQYELKRNTHRENQIKSVYQSDLSLLKKKKVNRMANQEHEQFEQHSKKSQEIPILQNNKSRLQLDTKPDKISMAEKERQSQDEGLSRVASDFKMAISNK